MWVRMRMCITVVVTCVVSRGVVVLLALVWVPGGVRRWRRRARLTLVGAGGPGAAGAAWAEFVDSARDLGWMDVDEGVGAQPRAHTPEALVEHLDSRGPLPGRARDAAAMLAGAVVAERFGGGDATVPVSTELANALDLAVDTIYVRDRAPADAILDTARTQGVDLVVMASHGRSGLQKWLLGSQTQAVIVRGTLPVLVVR